MKAEIIAVGTAMAFFGLVAGWIIGSQQARAVVPAASASAAAQSEPAPPGQAPVILDQAAVQALRNTIDRDPKNAAARTQLANLYLRCRAVGRGGQVVRRGAGR